MNSLSYSGKLKLLVWFQCAVFCRFIEISGVAAELNQVSRFIDTNTSFTQDSDRTQLQNENVNDSLPLTSYTSNTLETMTFPWDKTTMSARQYQISFCGQVCHGKQVVFLPRPGRCSLIECFPCDCDKPRCQDYGTCCPDYRDLLPVNSSDNSENHHYFSSSTNDTNPPSDQSLDLKLGCDGSSKDRVLYIRSCPSNYSRSDVRTKCEADEPLGKQVLDTFLHVTDTVTWHTYYNQYCATCNSIPDFTIWDLSVKCDDYMRVYQASSLKEFLTLIQDLDSRCELSQKAPYIISKYKCPGRWLHSPIVATCNTTGIWQVYDEEVERGCGEESAIVGRVRHVNSTLHIYRNVFCAICNMNGVPEFSNHCPESMWNDKPPGERVDLLSPFLPFSVLLNFYHHKRLRDSSDVKVSKCSDEREWTGPDFVCISMQCSPGKILTNGSCSTAISLISGLVYRTRITYWPRLSVDIGPNGNTRQVVVLSSVTTLDDYLVRFKDLIDGIVSEVVQEADIRLTMTVRDYVNGSHERFHRPLNETNVTHPGFSDQFEIYCFAIEGYFLAVDFLSRSEAETYLVDALIATSINFSVSPDQVLTLTPMLTADRRDTHLDCESFQDERLSCIQATLMQSEDEDYNYTLHSNKQQAILLEPLLTCPFVTFKPDQFKYDNNSCQVCDISSITLYIGDAAFVISEINELNLLSITDDGKLKVCRELLDKKVKKPFAKYPTTSLVKMSQYLLTWVCLIASILCLAATLITYSLFPVLRSVAGKINMFLCGSLLLAQSALLATSHLQPNSQLCTFFAISTHFWWLSMFCWCFTSCRHMFHTFSSKTRSDQTTASSERRYIVKRLVACWVVPSLVVITVVVINYFSSHGRVIGYGQTTCFLDSPTLLGVTLVAPMCLILLSNICFFTITVLKINNIIKLQIDDSQRDNRNNLYIYVKLSSMTGMFWLLAVISESTNNDLLRFVYISLNGLQGVFIFLSYICNRRVLRLYSGALGLEKTVQAQRATTQRSTSQRSTSQRSTSQRSTLAAVFSDAPNGHYTKGHSSVTNNQSVDSSQPETE